MSDDRPRFAYDVELRASTEQPGDWYVWVWEKSLTDRNGYVPCGEVEVGLATSAMRALEGAQAAIAKMQKKRKLPVTQMRIRL